MTSVSGFSSSVSGSFSSMLWASFSSFSMLSGSDFSRICGDFCAGAICSPRLFSPVCSSGLSAGSLLSSLQSVSPSVESSFALLLLQEPAHYLPRFPIQSLRPHQCQLLQLLHVPKLFSRGSSMFLSNWSSYAPLLFHLAVVTPPHLLQAMSAQLPCFL